MGIFDRRTSTTQNTVNNYDQRSVVGEGAITGSNNVLTEETNYTDARTTNTTTFNTVTDLGAVGAAFKFADANSKGAFDLASDSVRAVSSNAQQLQTGLTRLGQLGNDVFDSGIKFARGNFDQSLDFADAQVGGFRDASKKQFDSALSFSNQSQSSVFSALGNFAKQTGDQFDSALSFSNQSQSSVSSALSNFAKQTGDQFKQALEFSNQAATRNADVQGRAFSAIDKAYQDAQGAGQRGDKLIIGALVLAGVVALFALRK